MAPVSAAQIRRADVLVLGAGPGGMATALGLERAGVNVAVLEARGATATRPNVVDLSPEAVGVLRELGAEQLLVGRTAASRRGAEGATISLAALENGLRGLAAERGVPVHYGARAVGLEAAADGAEQVVRLADGGAAQGRFVVNATGGRSGIEEQLGMQLRFNGDWTWFGAVRTPHSPQLPSGERVGGLLGLRENGMRDTGTTLVPTYERLAMPEHVERYRGTLWYGWQNPIDGLSAFQPIGSRELQELSHAELAAKLLAPARAHGVEEVLDAPRLIRAESASVEHARVGAVLAIGDAAGRAHPKHMRGTQLALLDAERAAHAVQGALRQPARADELLDRYADATRAAHAEFGHDGTIVLADDPFRGLGQDVLELDGLAAWPTGAAPVA